MFNARKVIRALIFLFNSQIPRAPIFFCGIKYLVLIDSQQKIGVQAASRPPAEGAAR